MKVKSTNAKQNVLRRIKKIKNKKRVKKLKFNSFLVHKLPE